MQMYSHRVRLSFGRLYTAMECNAPGLQLDATRSPLEIRKMIVPHSVWLAGGVEALALEVLSDVVPVLPAPLQDLALNAIDYIAVFQNEGIEELVLRVLGGKNSRESASFIRCHIVRKLFSRLLTYSCLLLSWNYPWTGCRYHPHPSGEPAGDCSGYSRFG